MSFDLILPFLRPIEQYIKDDRITEIMVNPTGQVFVERDGRLAEPPAVTINPKYLNIAVKNIARLLGDDISESRPILDARLPDGSRVAAVYSPCSVGGTTLTIRKFGSRLFALNDLVETGSVDGGAAEWLVKAVRARKNLLVSGGTGTGKTTLLGALLAEIPQSERLILIEDTAEIRLSKPNLVRFEARRANSDCPEVTIRDLVKASLRHRPDRIVIGEVRGGEAFDLLQALNTGHSGTVSTIHASSAKRALTRFAHCVLQSGIALSFPDASVQIADAVDAVVQIERDRDRRVVTEIVAIDGFDADRGVFQLQTVYTAWADQSPQLPGRSRQGASPAGPMPPAPSAA